MNKTNLLPPVPQSPGMSTGDIYYALFRHKWKIIICSIVGCIAAGVFHKVETPPFRSEAKLLIKYVVDSRTLGASGDDSRIKSTDRGGESVINTEVQILNSMDLAEEVAKVMGPAKILGPEGKDISAAAAVIHGNLLVFPAGTSSVIDVIFSHPNPAIVQPVLTEIIEQYLKRHHEIHRATGDDFLARETDELGAKLAQTETELRAARNKAGVIVLADSKTAYASEIARLRQELLSAQADLAERSSLLQEMNKQAPTPTNPWSQETEDTGPEPTVEQLKQYHDLMLREEVLKKREQELLTYFQEENSRVQEIRSQITEVEAQKKNLVQANPRLALSRAASPSTASSGVPDVATETARIAALSGKIKVLNLQLEAVRAEAAAVDQQEGNILQLMRQKELEERNYRNYAASLEQARINEALGVNAVSNISQIQSPSPPVADRSKLLKITLGLAGAGITAGLAWAFLIEFYFDRSIRRPIEVERMLRLPLFLSIPKLSPKQLGHRTPQKGALSLPAGEKPKTPERKSLVPWDDSNPLHEFHETLRDRLIGYFENKGLTHKPKLVAVTGLGRSGGVTTTAAGLAASLSETGDGNVLLVDMTQGQGSAHQFYHGKPVVGLEEILDTRESAQIEGYLYVVGQEPGGEKLSRILPARFNKIVPKLKASNFDYIIFDMPPVSQISITPRLAGFMDMVLLVIESEKTDRELVHRATALLAESNAHVGAILNKTKTYVPPKLYQENLGNS